MSFLTSPTRGSFTPVAPRPVGNADSRVSVDIHTVVVRLRLRNCGRFAVIIIMVPSMIVSVVMSSMSAVVVTAVTSPVVEPPLLTHSSMFGSTERHNDPKRAQLNYPIP